MLGLGEMVFQYAVHMVILTIKLPWIVNDWFPFQFFYTLDIFIQFTDLILNRKAY